jgi:hypothetical protein
VGTRCDVPSGRVILAFHLELPNVLTCRDRCAQVSRITWRTSVAHHPTEDTAHQVRCLTSFSTSSRRAPPGPESAPPPEDRGAGQPTAPRLRARRPASRWLGAHVPTGCRSKTAELAINDRHPVSAPLAPSAGYPSPWLRLARRLIVGSRIAPLAIMGSAVRPGARQGRLRRRKRSSKLGPLTRTAPNLRSAAIGAMRRDCPPFARLTGKCQPRPGSARQGRSEAPLPQNQSTTRSRR